MKLIKPLTPFRKRQDYINNNRPNYPGLPYELFTTAQRIRTAVARAELTIVLESLKAEVGNDPQN